MSPEKKDPVVTMSGSPIYRHGEAAAWQAAQGEMCLAEISQHIETHLGKVETVFHELVSDTVHIDVHLVNATANFPFRRLVTSGMSDLPMAVPAEAEAPRYAELMATLPDDWKLDQESFKEDSWYWPVRLLKGLARLPHKHNTWLGWGHSIPNGDPAEPYAPDTKLCGAIVLPSITAPEDFQTLTIDENKTIQFYAVVPLYAEEMALKLRLGTNALLDKLSKQNLTDIITVDRPNIARRRFGLF